MIASVEMHTGGNELASVMTQAVSVISDYGASTDINLRGKCTAIQMMHLIDESITRCLTISAETI
jgi:hypothetical protein